VEQRPGPARSLRNSLIPHPAILGVEDNTVGPWPAPGWRDGARPAPPSAYLGVGETFQCRSLDLQGDAPGEAIGASHEQVKIAPPSGPRLSLGSQPRAVPPPSILQDEFLDAGDVHVSGYNTPVDARNIESNASVRLVERLEKPYAVVPGIGRPDSDRARRSSVIVEPLMARGGQPKFLRRYFCPS